MFVLIKSQKTGNVYSLLCIGGPLQKTKFEKKTHNYLLNFI